MNVNTGEVKDFSDLTETERSSGEWIGISTAQKQMIERNVQKARREAAREILRENKLAASPKADARKAKAEAKRQRKSSRQD